MPTLITPEQIEALRRIDTPTVCNAIEKLGIRRPTDGSTGAEIRCLLPQLGIMVGYAVTARFASSDPDRPATLDGYWALYDALDGGPKPSVVVVEEVGPRPAHACVFGDGMSTMAARLGAVGLVTNSTVRDLAGIRSVGFQVFAQGVVPTHGNMSVLDAQTPVEISGVRVTPGDIVHGDENGVVVFPPEITVDVVRIGQEIQASESKIFADFRRPNWTWSDFKARNRPE